MKEITFKELIDQLENPKKGVFVLTEQVATDFSPLKKYIRDNYLGKHPKELTLERLKQIKRNISKWKLQLKDLNIASDLQQFISETIENIDLQIERHTQKQLAENEFQPSSIKKKAASIEKVKPFNKNLSLANLFADVSKYKIVMEMLVAREYCQEHSFAWIDKGTGYKTKVGWLTRALFYKGYFKSKDLPGATVLKQAVLNTFKIKISESTLNHQKAYKTPKEFDFIKLASQVS